MKVEPEAPHDGQGMRGGGRELVLGRQAGRRAGERLSSHNCELCLGVMFFPTGFQLHLPRPELPKHFPNQSDPFLMCSRCTCKKLEKCRAKWEAVHL